MEKMKCWEYMQCGRDKTRDCPVVTKNMGYMCWLVAGTMCNGKPQGTFVQKMGDCKRCEFYKYMKK